MLIKIVHREICSKQGISTISEFISVHQRFNINPRTCVQRGPTTASHSVLFMAIPRVIKANNAVMIPYT